MLPPVSTRHLLTAIETKRREDAEKRWTQVFQPGQPPSGSGRRDVASRRSGRR